MPDDGREISVEDHLFLLKAVMSLWGSPSRQKSYAARFILRCKFDDPSPDLFLVQYSLPVGLQRSFREAF
ncbi:hypothetical protein EBB79_05705 [Parasedimentitalea marina]|uniref:Uncharacterized protein n=1 Tax=Parasedimentitalea marina TaxID=2483033 RepID=A0A3T0N0A7_9RHOB|nr:hypothetical protein EBB79_05705 [Parasedimentitalea marina]